MSEIIKNEKTDPKETAPADELSNTVPAETTKKRGRGRPPGSKNKQKRGPGGHFLPLDLPGEPEKDNPPGKDRNEPPPPPAPASDVAPVEIEPPAPVKPSIWGSFNNFLSKLLGFA